MPRKDVLAAGQRSAQFVGGVGDGVDLHKVSDEARDDWKPEPTPAARRKKFIPAGEVLLVRRAEAKLGSGILELAESVEKEQPAEGTIIGVSRVHGHAYYIGQYIAFGRYSGTLFKLNGEELLLLEAEEVKGEIIDEEEQDGE
jgi:co-chaperonin GroES (HSP10)